MIGWLIFLGFLGWFMAIVALARLYTEQDRRRKDREDYRAAIRELRQQVFTADIRRAHREPPPGAVLVPQDGWIARDNGLSH